MKTLKQLQEGLYDPNIFKAFFMAGGPGSGKSYVVRKSTGGTGLKIVNSDVAFEKLLKKAGLSLKMPDDELVARDKVRGKAKALTKLSRDNYVEGRLGLVIDGTGKDYNKITTQAADLKQIGYDVPLQILTSHTRTFRTHVASGPKSMKPYGATWIHVNQDFINRLDLRCPIILTSRTNLMYG